MPTKKVTKHWGHELWIAEGKNEPYALKRILFKAGKRTSLQVHKNKFETNYVLSGKGKLYISQTPLDIDKFLTEGMSDSELELYQKNMNVIDLYEGVNCNISPGYVHRVEAITDLEFIEASTIELDDVIRLQDDIGRSHGKIESEHK
jgi:mannose-6-phosphate isomerase-like protein (cupin superfamily)